MFLPFLTIPLKATTKAEYVCITATPFIFLPISKFRKESLSVAELQSEKSKRIISSPITNFLWPWAKRFSEKSQEVKEVSQVSGTEFDTAVQQKIAEENWKLVDKAFETITDPEHAKEAQYLLAQFKRTGDGALLEQARSFLDKRIDRKLEVDAMNMAARIQQAANEHRQEIILKPLSDELDKMAEEDPEFMNDTTNQDLMAMAIRLNPMKVDVRAVKKAIQDYSKTQYQKGYEAAKKEYAKQIETKAVPVKSVAKVETPVAKKPVEAMSIEDQLKEEYKDLNLL